MSLDSDIDRLYQLPLEEFTSARNALATRVKSAGDAAGAARVKALVKPSASAWAVNQLYWRMRPDFDEVVTAGDAVRVAQQRALAGRKGSDVRRATAEREKAVARSLRSIDGLAAKAGVDLSPQIRRRVQTTIAAIATHGSARDTLRDGRLTEDVGLPGFEALAALAAMAPLPAATARAGRATKGRRRAAAGAASERASARRREAEVRRARAQAELAAAEAHARALRSAADRAAAEAAEAARRATRAREDVDLAKRQLADAMARATKALDAVREAKHVASKAAAAASAADAAARLARSSLERLER